MRKELSHYYESSVDLENAQEFHINPGSMGRIIQLLGNIYSDPLKAVVREYLSNALDAHRDAGTDLPIEISFGSLSNKFSIRDYGNGLTDEQIKYYIMGFGSTGDEKMSDPGQIGDMGIGSKSFIAVSSTAVYRSYRGGTVSTWLCQLNEKRQGFISKINEESTEEPDGFEVEIPLESSQISELSAKVDEITQFLDYPLIINGVKWNSPLYEYNHECGRYTPDKEVLFEYNNKTYKALVFIGGYASLQFNYADRKAVINGIPYNLEGDLCKKVFGDRGYSYNPFSSNGSEFNTYNPVVMLEDGILEYSPDRETIVNNEKNAEALRSMVNDISVSYKKRITEDLYENDDFFVSLTALSVYLKRGLDISGVSGSAVPSKEDPGGNINDIIYTGEELELLTKEADIYLASDDSSRKGYHLSPVLRAEPGNPQGRSHGDNVCIIPRGVCIQSDTVIRNYPQWIINRKSPSGIQTSYCGDGDYKDKKRVQNLVFPFRLKVFNVNKKHDLQNNYRRIINKLKKEFTFIDNSKPFLIIHADDKKAEDICNRLGKYTEYKGNISGYLNKRKSSGNSSGKRAARKPPDWVAFNPRGWNDSESWVRGGSCLSSLSDSDKFLYVKLDRYKPFLNLKGYLDLPIIVGGSNHTDSLKGLINFLQEVQKKHDPLLDNIYGIRSKDFNKIPDNAVDINDYAVDLLSRWYKAESNRRWVMTFSQMYIVNQCSQFLSGRHYTPGNSDLFDRSKRYFIDILTAMKANFSDRKIENMLGDTYLSRIFREFNKIMSGVNSDMDAVFEYGTDPECALGHRTHKLSVNFGQVKDTMPSSLRNWIDVWEKNKDKLTEAYPFIKYLDMSDFWHVNTKDRLEICKNTGEYVRGIEKLKKGEL